MLMSVLFRNRYILISFKQLTRKGILTDELCNDFLINLPQDGLKAGRQE
jgi:hypothetical protein